MSGKGTVPPMCGIVGYVGGKAALDVVVEGLRRLEYRGYDSAGVAIVADETLHVAKKAGKLGNLEKLLAEEQLPRSGLGIGHTRWRRMADRTTSMRIRIPLLMGESPWCTTESSKTS